MPADLLGNRFAGYREPAWHKLGTVFTEHVTPMEAMALADADIEISKHPMVTTWQPTEQDELQVIETPRFALMRPAVDDETAPVYLGDASKEYVVVQNRDVVKMLEPIAAQWPVETTGVLKNGAVFFMALDVGEYEIAGEKNRQYLLVHTSHDGSSALRVQQVSVRVVCSNTLAMASESASTDFSLRHTGDVQKQAEWHVKAIASLRTSLQETQEEQQIMAAVKTDDAMVSSIINAAYPMPIKPKGIGNLTKLASADVIDKSTTEALMRSAKSKQHQYEIALKRAEALRLTTGEVFINMYKATNIGGTVWGAVNAVTETSNWREGPNADSSVMFGVRRDEGNRAYEQARKIVGVAT